MNKTDAAGLVEQLRALAATWRKHVEAVERLNAAIPPLEATPAERALYGERYKAKDVAEREMRATAMRFAQWCAETDVAESVAAPPLGDVDELCGKDARELLAAEIRADWIASYPAEAVPSETYALKEAANQPAALRAIEKALSALPALMARVAELEATGQAIIDHMSSTYRARNGREVGIQGEDGEKCWIVHSDDITALEAVLGSSKGSGA